MKVSVHKIRSKKLSSLIQRIIFLNGDKASTNSFECYPNHNVCLGILKSKTLSSTYDELQYKEKPNAITSYVSGLYSKVQKFKLNSCIDEICIDFTVKGYFCFFKQPLQKFSAGRILENNFGESSSSYFRNIFDKNDLQERAALIEAFFENQFTQPEIIEPILKSLVILEENQEKITVSELAQKAACSERTITRLFKKYLNINPKELLQIIAFRNALGVLNSGDTITQVAHSSGFYDQSHFGKQFKKLTSYSPSDFLRLEHMGSFKDDLIITTS